MSITYTPNEERANYLSHALGILIGLIANTIFLDVVYKKYDELAQLGIWLYAFGMLSSYIFSTIYHASKLGTKQRERYRKLDHAAIYWHIAGSYSPIILIGMRNNMCWGWTLFIIVWTCAFVGSFMSFYKLKEHSNLETSCFIGMGLTILIAFNPVLDSIGWNAMKWIIAEGGSFITGALFYSMNKKIYMHTVFHVFVLIGSIFHIIAIWMIL